MSKFDKFLKFTEDMFFVYLNYLEKKGVSTGRDLNNKRRDLERMARRKDLTDEQRAILEQKFELLNHREEALSDYTDQLNDYTDKINVMCEEIAEKEFLKERALLLEQYTIELFENIDAETLNKDIEDISKIIVNNALILLDEQQESHNIELAKEYIKFDIKYDLEIYKKST